MALIFSKTWKTAIQVYWIHSGSFDYTYRPCSKILFSDSVVNYIVSEIEHAKASIKDVPCPLMKEELQKVHMYICAKWPPCTSQGLASIP